jgi:hypothetical protein
MKRATYSWIDVFIWLFAILLLCPWISRLVTLLLLAF